MHRLKPCCGCAFEAMIASRSAAVCAPTFFAHVAIRSGVHIT